MNNLLSNAVKFTPHKGRINITALSLYKEIEISVSDTGAGIPEKDLPYIFQKFYRVNRPGTEIPGTGLGLVFVKQIVDLHKGFITIQSEVNKGTTVILKLPKESKV
jgi:signal transduction histidine kinase